MISIVICSKDRELLKQVSKNVDSTIGVPYEIIVIDNSEGRMGICEAYNSGAKDAKYDIICFMHEDIKYITQQWGKKVCNILDDYSIGIIGVAGGRVKTKMPEGWWMPGGQYNRVNIMQHFRDESAKLMYTNINNEQISDVLTVDGVWFCCRKLIWAGNKFDALTFKEFHFYDADFSMQVYQNGYRICVVYNILIEHFSTGSLNKSWVKNAIKFSNKWSKYLPLSLDELHQNKLRKLTFHSNIYFLNILMRLEIKNIYFYKHILKYMFSNRKGYTINKIFKEFIRRHYPYIFYNVKHLYTQFYIRK